MNPYVIIAATALGVFLVSLTAALIVKKKKGADIAPVKLAVLFGLFAGGAAYALFGRQQGDVYVPFGLWTRVREVGYNAVWMGFLDDVLPFAAAGFALPWAAKKARTLGTAAICALAAAALMAALNFAIKPFDMDTVTGAFLGILIGFGLFAFIKLLIPKVPPFKGVEFKRATHLSSLIVVLAIYMACVALILVDSGGDFEKLNMFRPDTELPADMTITAELSDERTSAMTYKTVDAKPEQDVLKIAAAFGIQGDVLTNSNDDKVTRAYVRQGEKELLLSLTGEWRCTDDTAPSADAEALSREQFIERAVGLTKNGALDFATYQAGEVTTGKKTVNGVSKETCTVYLSAMLDGHPVQGSCEVAVGMWYDGTVYSIDKYNADFAEYKSMTIISQKEAWEMAKTNDAAHTLWSAADSATIDSVRLAYWLEEIKGYMQPVWMFSGTAHRADGTQTAFDIFVPALDY